MRRAFIIAALAVALAPSAHANDTWVFFSAGGVRTSPGVMGTSASMSWPSAEFSMGKSKPDTSTKFIHGWSVGFRKEDPGAENGTYFTLRYEFRKFRRLGGIVRPSVGLTYGVPGVMLDRSWDTRDARGDQISYGRVAPTRMVGFPFFKVSKAGIIYPSILFSTRHHLFGGVYVEPTAGAHIMQFNHVYANFQSGDVVARDRWTVAPTLSVRISIRAARGEEKQQ